MKICIALALCCLLLTGCASEPTLETVTDEIVQPVMVTAYTPTFTLPKDAAVTTLESEENGTIYFCDGYTVTVCSLPAGDLNQTILDTTGFTSDALTLVKTSDHGCQRIQCVWSAAGEEGEQLGRLTVLDDGVRHHVLSCMTAASEAPKLSKEIQELMDSFRLVSPEALDTGS